MGTDVSGVEICCGTAFLAVTPRWVLKMKVVSHPIHLVGWCQSKSEVSLPLLHTKVPWGRVVQCSPYRSPLCKCCTPSPSQRMGTESQHQVWIITFWGWKPGMTFHLLFCSRHILSQTLRKDSIVISLTWSQGEKEKIRVKETERRDSVPHHRVC